MPPNGNVIDFFTDILPNGTPRLALLRSFDKGATWEARPTIVTTMSFSLTGTITPDLQEPVRDACDPVRRRGRPDQRQAVRRLAGHPLPRHRPGGLLAVQRQRCDLVDADPDRPHAARTRNILRQQAFVPSIEVGPDGELVVTYYNFQNDTAETAEATDYWSVFCSRRLHTARKLGRACCG